MHGGDHGLSALPFIELPSTAASSFLGVDDQQGLARTPLQVVALTP